MTMAMVTAIVRGAVLCPDRHHDDYDFYYLLPLPYYLLWLWLTDRDMTGRSALPLRIIGIQTALGIYGAPMESEAS